jgi:hypothetical protein
MNARLFDGRKALSFLPLAVSVLLLLYSVHGDSLWMDEGQTFSLLHHSSFSGMVHALATRGGAVSGMPLFFVLEFFWCKLFGLGEFAMRSMNYVFATLALLGALRLLAEAKLPRWTLPLFAVHPVLVYYMNEARPYVALYACGLWGFLFLFRYAADPRKRHLVGFFFCLLAGCALHMMFLFAGAAYACFLLYLLLAKKLSVRDHLVAGLPFVPFFAALGAYYLRFALGAPELGFPTSPLSGIFQIGWYFTGLGGLGWSRQALRTYDFALSPRIAVELPAALLAWLAFLVCCFRAKVLRDRRAAVAFACAATALAAFLGANIVLGTRFWERHAIYLLPAFLFVLASAGRDIVRTLPGWGPKAAVGALLAAHLLSACNLAALPGYRKEDYRGAIAIARSMNPDRIFYQGNRFTHNYYGLSGVWGRDAVKQPDVPIESDVNISTASWEELRSLLDRVQGRTVLILLDRDEFDTAGFYKILSGAGRHANAFAVLDAADIPPEALSPETNPLWTRAKQAW